RRRCNWKSTWPVSIKWHPTALCRTLQAIRHATAGVLLGDNMLISTIVFLFFLFLTYALFLLSSRKSDARQARLQQRVAEALRDLEVPVDTNIEISRRDSIGGNTTINRILSGLDFVKTVDRLVRQADIHI